MARPEGDPVQFVSWDEYFADLMPAATAIGGQLLDSDEDAERSELLEDPNLHSGNVIGVGVGFRSPALFEGVIQRQQGAADYGYAPVHPDRLLNVLVGRVHGNLRETERRVQRYLGRIGFSSRERSVEVLEVGAVSSSAFSGAAKISNGCVVANVSELGASGTLGAIVVDERGSPVMLSCAHVLGDVSLSQRRETVAGPGFPLRPSDPVVGALVKSRFSLSSVNTIDAAVSRFLDPYTGDVTTFLRGAAAPDVGLRPDGEPITQASIKVGAASGSTGGQILKKDTVTIKTQWGCARFADVYLVAPWNHQALFSEAGDSGAVVTDWSKEKALGMVIGVTRKIQRFTVMCSSTLIQQQLGVRFG